MPQERSSIFYLFCLIRVSASLLDDSKVIQVKCDANDDCFAEFFCCGSCDRTYCCQNAEYLFNTTKCDEMKDEDTVGLSINMLGAILGGMIGSIIFAIILQHYVQSCLRNARLQQSSEIERLGTTDLGNADKNGAQNDVYPDAPPIYEHVHLYRKPDPQKSPNVSIITLEMDTEIEPPSYKNLFDNQSFEYQETTFKNIQEIEVSTITAVFNQTADQKSSSSEASPSRQTIFDQMAVSISDLKINQSH